MDEWPSTEVICDIRLDEKTFVRRRPEVQHERTVALYDLLQENRFRVLKEDVEGPYLLRLSLEGEVLRIGICDAADFPLAECRLPMIGFRSLVKDYLLMCDSYYGAIRAATPSKIEAIDMGRRGLHNEGGVMMRERLREQDVDVDLATARRLFTLVCVLHIRG